MASGRGPHKDGVLIRSLADKGYWIEVMLRALRLPEDRTVQVERQAIERAEAGQGIGVKVRGVV